jgi:hypothetical protein
MLPNFFAENKIYCFENQAFIDFLQEAIGLKKALN